jgi:two-component system sensor histidine kinase/response regulator
LEETPKQLNELAKSIEQGNNTLQHEISHKIQGMSANLSAHVLLQYTKDFNHYVKQSDPAQDEVEILFQAMQLSYQALEQQLQQTLNDNMVKN